MPAPEGEITAILSRIREGDRDAFQQLFPVVYSELLSIAAGKVSGEQFGHTLQRTALVHEAYLRLSRCRHGWNDRTHFFRVAAVAMRSVLVNHARDRKRQKRGGGVTHLPWHDDVARVEARTLDLLGLDDALHRLHEIDSRQVQVVELRFFAGLTVDETAEVLGVSARTVQSDWRLARAWLFRELNGGSSTEID